MHGAPTLSHAHPSRPHPHPPPLTPRLYLEQPEDFNRLLLDFVDKGNAGRPKVAHIA